MKFFAIVLTIFLFRVCQSKSYFWEEYRGVVPSEAFVAGQDNEGNNIYVGQAYIKSAGLIVGSIHPGERYMYAPYGGVIIVGKFVKVLCGAEDDFYWMKANSTNLQTVVTGRIPVIGGHEDVSNDYLHIGRDTVKGELKVGKIGPISSENAYFYFNNDGFEGKLGEYEVLMYKHGTNSVETIKGT